MRTLRVQLLVAFALLLLPMLATPSLAQTGEKMSKSDLQKMYMTFLKSEGYRPEIDEDGDIKFKHEGMTYYVMVGDVDPGFFRLALANIWPIESEDERIQVLFAMDHCNAQAKVAKAYMVNDNVWVAAEIFVGKPNDFEAIFRRSLMAIQNGVELFVKKMKE